MRIPFVKKRFSGGRVWDPNSKSQILILDEESGFGGLLRDELLGEGFSVTMVNTCIQARAVISKEAIELVITEVKRGSLDEFELLELIKEISPKIPVIIIKIMGEWETMALAYGDRFFSYFNKPFKMRELIFSVRQALQM